MQFSIDREYNGETRISSPDAPGWHAYVQHIRTKVWRVYKGGLNKDGSLDVHHAAEFATRDLAIMDAAAWLTEHRKEQ